MRLFFFSMGVIRDIFHFVDTVTSVNNDLLKRKEMKGASRSEHFFRKRVGKGSQVDCVSGREQIARDTSLG